MPDVRYRFGDLPLAPADPGATDPGSTDPGSTPDPGSRPGGDGTAENPGWSCAQLHKDHPGLPSGPLFVLPVDATGPVEVYCDMTTGGGGWTRVAATAAEMPICSLAQAVGSQATLLLPVPPSTAVLPVSTAGAIPFAGEILVSFADGYYVFGGTHPAWSWKAVAEGAIHQSNIGDHAVKGAANGGKPQSLASVAAKPAAKGPLLLGGQHPDGSLSAHLGTGAYATGVFQQEGCTGSVLGFYSGTASPAPAWKSPGTVSIR